MSKKLKVECYTVGEAKKLLAGAGDDPQVLGSRFGMLDGFMFNFYGITLVDEIKREIERTEGLFQGKYLDRGIAPCWGGRTEHLERHSFPNANGAIQAIVDTYRYPNHQISYLAKRTIISFQHGPYRCVGERVNLFRRDAVIDFLDLFEHLELDPLIYLQECESGNYTFEGWYNINGSHRKSREQNTN